MEFLITFVLVVYLLGIAARWLMPILLKKFLSNMMEHRMQPESGDGVKSERSERKTSFFGRKPDVLKVRLKEGQRISDVLGGEYVEYEEVM